MIKKLFKKTVFKRHLWYHNSYDTINMLIHMQNWDLRKRSIFSRYMWKNSFLVSSFRLTLLGHAESKLTCNSIISLSLKICAKPRPRWIFSRVGPKHALQADCGDVLQPHQTHDDFPSPCQTSLCWSMQETWERDIFTKKYLCPGLSSSGVSYWSSLVSLLHPNCAYRFVLYFTVS